MRISGIGLNEELSQRGIQCATDHPHVGQNLLDHPVMPHVSKLKDGYGLDGHLLRAGPMHDAEVAAYRKDHTGPYHSGLLKLAGFPRVEGNSMTSQSYRIEKERNASVDPFGPTDQPHFDIDCVVRIVRMLQAKGFCWRFQSMFGDAFQWHFPTPPEGDRLTVIGDLHRLISKSGEIKLRSASYADPLYITLNFANNLDLIATREGVRFMDDILMNSDGIKDIIGEDYPWPMLRHSDEAMNRAILERSQTGFRKCISSVTLPQ